MDQKDPTLEDDHISDASVRMSYMMHHGDECDMGDDEDSMEKFLDRLEHFQNFAKQHRVQTYMLKHNVSEDEAHLGVLEQEKEAYIKHMDRRNVVQEKKGER